MKIDAIANAAFEDNVVLGTHLVCGNELKRTVKLLCGVSCCDHILDLRWLNASAKAGKCLDERQYCLTDVEKEAQWAFSMRHTMYCHSRLARETFLKPYVFYLLPHKSLQPHPQDLAKIIRCAGGQVVTSIKVDNCNKRQSPSNNVIVIATIEAMAIVKMRKSVEHLSVYSPELLLRGILRQSLEWEEHCLHHHIVKTTGNQ